jgi:hypothetical protein
MDFRSELGATQRPQSSPIPIDLTDDRALGCGGRKVSRHLDSCVSAKTGVCNSRRRNVIAENQNRQQLIFGKRSRPIEGRPERGH